MQSSTKLESSLPNEAKLLRILDWPKGFLAAAANEEEEEEEAPLLLE